MTEAKPTVGRADSGAWVLSRGQCTRHLEAAPTDAEHRPPSGPLQAVTCTRVHPETGAQQWSQSTFTEAELREAQCPPRTEWISCGGVATQHEVTQQ